MNYIYSFVQQFFFYNNAYIFSCNRIVEQQWHNLILNQRIVRMMKFAQILTNNRNYSNIRNDRNFIDILRIKITFKFIFECFYSFLSVFFFNYKSNSPLRRTLRNDAYTDIFSTQRFKNSCINTHFS